MRFSCLPTTQPRVNFTPHGKLITSQVINYISSQVPDPKNFHHQRINDRTLLNCHSTPICFDTPYSAHNCCATRNSCCSSSPFRRASSTSQLAAPHIFLNTNQHCCSSAQGYPKALGLASSNRAIGHQSLPRSQVSPDIRRAHNRQQYTSSLVQSLPPTPTPSIGQVLSKPSTQFTESNGRCTAPKYLFPQDLSRLKPRFFQGNVLISYADSSTHLLTTSNESVKVSRPFSLLKTSEKTQSCSASTVIAKREKNPTTLRSEGTANRDICLSEEIPTHHIDNTTSECILQNPNCTPFQTSIREPYISQAIRRRSSEGASEKSNLSSTYVYISHSNSEPLSLDQRGQFSSSSQQLILHRSTASHFPSLLYRDSTSFSAFQPSSSNNDACCGKFYDCDLVAHAAHIRFISSFPLLSSVVQRPYFIFGRGAVGKPTKIRTDLSATPSCLATDLFAQRRVPSKLRFSGRHQKQARLRDNALSLPLLTQQFTELGSLKNNSLMGVSYETSTMLCERPPELISPPNVIITENKTAFNAKIGVSPTSSSSHQSMKVRLVEVSS